MNLLFEKKVYVDTLASGALVTEIFLDKAVLQNQIFGKEICLVCALLSLRLD